MRKTHILLYMGKPIVVSDDRERLADQARREAKLNPDRECRHWHLHWNSDRTRLFRQDAKGHDRFTGYEVREVVKA